MCVSDIRLARLVRHTALQWNTTGPVNTVFLPNPQRVGLMFGRDLAVLTATVGTVITFDTGPAIILPVYIPYILMRMEQYGDLVTRGFTITAIGTAHTGIVTQFTLPESVIASAIEEFKRNY